MPDVNAVPQLCELSHDGCIAVTGEDAPHFLQGQLTGDIRRLEQPLSLLAGYCNPQGRLLACLRLWRQSPGYVLRLPRELVAPVMQRLQLFVLRAKVTLTDLSDHQRGLGLIGSTGPDGLAEYFTTVPTAIGQVVHERGCWIIRVPGEQPRFELYGAHDSLDALRRSLMPQVTVADTRVWQQHNIRAGLPEVYRATQDRFIPQMLNLDQLDGVAFDKGCYVGQEIVARTHYLGRLKRRMYRLYSEHAPPLQPGDTLTIVGYDDAQANVQVVQAITTADTGVEFLGVLPIELSTHPSLALVHNEQRFEAIVVRLDDRTPVDSV